MMARGFKPVGWVAAVAGAALGCYMLSLNVASERSELASIERRIIATKQEIRSLQTELGTRGRLAQLDRWNAEVLALSAPTSKQFLEDEFVLARFDRREKTFEERAKVQMAAAPAPQQKAEPKRPPVILASAETPAAKEQAQPLVRQASLVVVDQEEKPAAVKKAAASKPALLGDDLVAEIGQAARAEKKADKKVKGAAGQ